MTPTKINQLKGILFAIANRTGKPEDMAPDAYNLDVIRKEIKHWAEFPEPEPATMGHPPQQDKLQAILSYMVLWLEDVNPSEVHRASAIRRAIDELYKEEKPKTSEGRPPFTTVEHFIFQHEKNGFFTYYASPCLTREDLADIHKYLFRDAPCLDEAEYHKRSDYYWKWVVPNEIKQGFRKEEKPKILEGEEYVTAICTRIRCGELPCLTRELTDQQLAAVHHALDSRKAEMDKYWKSL